MSGTAPSVRSWPTALVITLELTEPAGGIQDFTWTPTVNRFQAVLRKDGSIEPALRSGGRPKDAIVGLYPMVTAGVAKKRSAAIATVENAAVTGDLNQEREALGDRRLFLKMTLETRRPVMPEGTRTWRALRIGSHSTLAISGLDHPRRGVRRARRTRGRGTALRGVGAGRCRRKSRWRGMRSPCRGRCRPRVSPAFDRVYGGCRGRRWGRRTSSGPGAPSGGELTGIQSAALDLSAVKKQDGPFAMAYEILPLPLAAESPGSDLHRDPGAGR